MSVTIVLPKDTDIRVSAVADAANPQRVIIQYDGAGSHEIDREINRPTDGDELLSETIRVKGKTVVTIQHRPYGREPWRDNTLRTENWTNAIAVKSEDIHGGSGDFDDCIVTFSWLG